jgi:hypothetical protein
MGDTSLNQYVSAAFTQKAAVPSSLGAIGNLRSAASGNVILGISPSTSRIAVWSDKNDKLTLSKQISLRDGKKLYDATYDQKQGKVFATVDNRLVSFPFKP